MKKVIRSVLVFWGIVTILLLCCLIYLYFTVGEGSYWIFAKDTHEGNASATAWLDKNADGIKDTDEASLPDVLVGHSYLPRLDMRIPSDDSDPCEHYGCDFTDEKGYWFRYTIWNGECDFMYIYAKTPSGYQPTTNLASDGCLAQFGFVENNVTVSHKVTSVDDYVRHKITMLWITRIGVGLFIVAVAGFGTFWLEKRYNSRSQKQANKACT